MFRKYSSLSFAIPIFVAFLITLFSTGAMVSDQYMTCKSELFSCGKNILGIGYPFWGDGRPKYCGLPSMQLKCFPTVDGDQAFFKDTMKTETLYLVSKINTSNFTVLIKWVDYICTSFMELGRILKFTQNTEVITFLYNCPRDTFSFNYTGEYLCQINEDQAFEAYYVPNVTARRNNASCRSSFEVPVLKSNLELYNKGDIENITAVIVGGFEAYYEHSEECFKCQNFGGLCGSSEDSSFVCHCKNGESKDMCRIKASSIPSKAFIFGGSAVLVAGIGVLLFVIFCC